MQLDSVLQALGAELIKLIITGTLGGFMGAWIGLRQFRSQMRFQTKYQDNLRRRDALRDILVILPIVFSDMHRGWDTAEAQEHISRFDEQITRTQTLFLNDQEIIKALTHLRSLIGADANSMIKAGRERPSDQIGKIRKLMESKINDLDKLLY